ncbi:RNA polymerase sigma factor [Leucothrix pacifica]|uniref:RNA polymerase subunit sigma-24 n=1 Tax=Leucothrix pacifica TaxID=1247513 RepID=A0A317CFM9_9GAMM|nr:sigma-70 family RNA polymerase sigma factor [Leucothrix pacifica]PWQ97398.1 RNA polymerase subunit sigma-24 [Leucothrix pacifica]
MLDKPLLNQLFRYAVSLTNQEDQAYDVLQSCVEKFLRIDRSVIESAEAYLMRMIRNEFIDQTRKKCFYSDVGPEIVSKISDESALNAITLEDVFIQQSEVGALLGTMSGDERELLYLWAVEEYTLEEISQMKQVPRGTLLSKLHRLKKRIQLQQNSDNVLNLRVKS